MSDTHFGTEVLFSSRAGLMLSGEGQFCRADWPLGRITLDREGLNLHALFACHRIRLSDIDAVRPTLLGVRVYDHSEDVPAFVSIWGIWIFRRLKRAAYQHGMTIPMATVSRRMPQGGEG